MINGKTYGWEHLTVQRDKTILSEIQMIDFERSSGINRRKGKGLKTRGYTRKAVEAKGKLKMTLEEYEIMLANDADMKKGGVYGAKPFDIVLTANVGDGKPTTLTLEDCVFVSDKYSGIEPDTEGVMVELSFEILGDLDINGARAFGAV